MTDIERHDSLPQQQATGNSSENSINKNSDEKFCSECGAVIKLKAEICPKCGVRQIPAPGIDLDMFGKTSPHGRNRILAVLIAFFLGGFGAHKFYLGQFGKGILYFVFCWTFIPSMIAFVEAIIYLSMTDEAFIQKYG